MFAVPNRLWVDAPNRYDIWGLDGYNPPEVKKEPDQGLPFQVVRYKNEIYQANARGKFTTPDIKIIDLNPHDENNQKKYEEENLGKHAIWNERVTNDYRKWLRKNAKLEDLASQLDYTISRNKLYEIRESYNSLKLSEKDQKKLMLKLYNRIYENKARSYTKDFMEFYEHRFDDNLERKISKEEKRIKDINKDLAKSKKAKERYKTSELRLFNLMAMIESKGYYDYDLKSLREKMLELKNSDNDGIVGDFIKNDLRDESGDSDMLYVDEKKLIDDYSTMQEYYQQRSYDDYLDYLQQEAIV